MANVTYETNNGSLDFVKVEATYRKQSQIPQIGQRKRMRVNGASQMLTLNDLKVKRVAEWNEEHNGPTYFFKASEEWGEYFIAW